MTEKEMIEYYKAETAILKHYGLKAQKQQFIQELAELIVALTKNDINNLVEEMADVQVMIDQFTINDIDLDLKMQEIQLAKVRRQLERIKNE
jgi:phosphoribosyl-ATP pyrophosphohydrolase